MTIDSREEAGGGCEWIALVDESGCERLARLREEEVRGCVCFQ